MEQVNYEKLIPDTPPEGLIPWMESEGRFNNHYIIYKHAWMTDPLIGTKEKMVQCVCSACGETFYMPRVEFDGCANVYARAPFGFENGTENVISGVNTICPHCGACVTAMHCGEFRYDKTINEFWPLSVDKVGNRLVLLTWYVARHLSSNGCTKIFCNPWEAYVVDDKKIVKLAGYQRFMNSISWFNSWHERQRFVDSFGKIHPDDIYPFSSDILVGTTAENCKLDKYVNECNGNVYPITYMNLWVKHKNVENLIMHVPNIVNEKIADISCYGVGPIKNIKGIDWKKKKPNEMIGLSKEEFRYCKKHKWSLEDFNFFSTAKNHGIKPEDVNICKRYRYYNVQRLFSYNANIMRVIRYLDKQRQKYPKQRKAEVSDITDYWDMMKKLGEDITDDKVRFPQNIIRAHDLAQERMEYKESQELQEQFDKRYKELEKFSYESGGLCIRPARSQFELVCEGKNLSHCVGSYAKRMARGETAIFFIRYSDTPDTSYFTLELNEKSLTVLQNRGKGNCARTSEVKSFEEEWLNHIKELMRKEKKNGKRSRKTAA